MKITFVNRFYWPEKPATGQLLTDLAEGLAARGFAVEVITSRGQGSIPAMEVRSGVQIVRTAGTRWASRAGILGKAADFATFWLCAVACVWQRTRRGDVVVAMTDPPLLGAGVQLAAHSRGAQCAHWVQDIYPEIAIRLAGLRALRVLTPLRDATWLGADGCVTLGHDMDARLGAAGVDPRRRSIVPNWALADSSSPTHEQVQSLRHAWGLEGKFILLYSGNLGRVHALEPLLDLAQELLPDSRLALVFVGEGAQRRQLEESASQRGLSNVRFFPPQPRDALAATLALADIHIVTLRADCADLVFPSKLYGAAAAGRPLVFVGPTDCEVARLVLAYRMGLTADPAHMRQLAGAVQTLAGDGTARATAGAQALAFAAAHSASSAIDHWAAICEAIGDNRPLPDRA